MLWLLTNLKEHITIFTSAAVQKALLVTLMQDANTFCELFSSFSRSGF